MSLPHMLSEAMERQVAWERFLEMRAARRQRALQQASALQADASAISPATLFSAWRFSATPDLAGVALRSLREHALSPSARQLWVALAPSEVLPAPNSPARMAAWLHRKRLLELDAAGVADTPTHRLAWALCELDFFGWETERRERLAWEETVYRPAPDKDAETASLWAGWFSGNPWGLRERWESLFLSPTIRTFRGVCEARRLPRDVIDRVTDDLEEGFFYRLLGGGGTAGWAELAARVLETSGPVMALAQVMPDTSWDRLSRCVATRGSWQESCAVVYASLPEPASRARALMRAGLETPARLEAWMDLHVVRRLLRAWRTAPETDAWAIISQNRGRARGRLRALVSGGPADALLEPLMDLNALYARSLAAVRRYAWAWAWQEMSLDFSFDISRSVTPPCEDVSALPDPFPEALRSVVETWVLLVVLRGRLSHLRRWVSTGSTGDRDSTWARLLSDALPSTLRDPGTRGRARSYRRLRVDLAENLDDHLLAIKPLLQQVARLKPGRGLKGRFIEQIRPHWEETVAFPGAGFPTFLKNAEAALAADLEES